MAKKTVRMSGGGEGALNSPGNSEHERFLNDIKLAIEGAFACLEKIKRLPAGSERHSVVESAETILRDAEKTAKNIVGGDMASGVILGALRATRKEFDGIKKNLAGASAAGIHAQERAVKREAALKEQEERELAEMQAQEDADRCVREAGERIDRGEGTDEDRRLIAEHDAKLLEEGRRPIIKLFEGTTSILKALRKMIKKGDWETARQNIELLERQLVSFRENYDLTAAQVAERGSQMGETEMLNFYKNRIDQFDGEIEKLRQEILEGERAEIKAQEAFLANQVKADEKIATRKDLGEKYAGLIKHFNAKMQDVFAMPIGTADEVEAARTALEELKKALDAHNTAWDDEVKKPIFQGADRPADAWFDLALQQRALRDGFQRDERIRRNALREKLDEVAKERWESELPAFELRLVDAEMRVLSARLLRGQKRKEAFEAIRDFVLIPIAAQWRGTDGAKGLRDFAPVLTREQIESGKRTERAAIDGKFSGLEKDIAAYIAAAETALPVRLDDAARSWRNILARTHQLWNPDTDLGARGVFLEEKYGPGEVREGSPEFTAMIPEDRRTNFEELANTEVLQALRRRARETQREKDAREREERRSLPGDVPRLNYVRLLADDAYWDLRNAGFWNSSATKHDFDRVLRVGKTMSDDELGKFVSDIPAARKAIEALEFARGHVTETEDIMLGKRADREKLTGETDAEGVLGQVNEYITWKQREAEMWRKAMQAEGWETQDPVERKKRLHKFFAGYWRLGPGKLAGVPEQLRGPIGNWAHARLHWRIFGEYTQWILDENSGIAIELRKQEKLPKEFVVDAPEERAELSAADQRAVNHFTAEQHQTDTPSDADGHDSAEEGSFTAATDTVARFMGDDAGGESGATGSGEELTLQNVPTPKEQPVATSANAPASESKDEGIEQILAGNFPEDPGAPRPLVPVRRDPAMRPVPRQPRPVDRAVPSTPVRSVPAPAGGSGDPFAGFFGGGAEAPAVEARPAPRAEAPRSPRAESAPVSPVQRADRATPGIKPVVPAPARVEVPIEAPVEAPRETHAEDRVASWSRSLRNTLGRLFGGAAAVSVVETPVTRAESLPPAEASRRTAGGLMSVLSRFFGPKIFADVPRYLPESFGDQNARALLEADILDALAENAAIMKNVAGDPERIHAANLDAAARLDRAIMTSTTAKGEPLDEAVKARLRTAVAELSQKYTEQTRGNALALSKGITELVEQSVRVLEAPGRRGSPALRLFSKLPFGIGTNLAHGVGDFRKRFEAAVSRGGDTGLVARVATVFRETWEEAMQGIRANGSLSGIAMNTAEAVAMIGSAYGLNAVITGIEKVFPNLRLLDGEEREEMTRMIAEGRLQVQEAVDGILPRAEQAAKRTT